MSRLSEFTPPTAAVEIASHRVTAVGLETRGGRPAIAAHATEPLPDGALVPSLTADSVHDRPFVLAAVNRVLDEIGRPRRIGLVIPDPVAKVSLVRFERVPPRPADLDQLIRWQVRKSAPFAIEEAQVSYVAGGRTAEGQEFVVSLARRAAIEEYESLCAPAGAQVGLVDISTFNVINAALAATGAAAGADWLLVNVAPDWASLAILRGPDLIFFRSRGSDGEGTLADLVHQTAMYYEDRIQGGGFSRVMLTGATTGLREPGDVDDLRRSLEERLGRPVETVDPRGAATLTDRINAAPSLLDTLTPLVGMLIRDRKAAA
jgi:Tfp pilus assembly PilM family ATPase